MVEIIDINGFYIVLILTPTPRPKREMKEGRNREGNKIGIYSILKKFL